MTGSLRSLLICSIDYAGLFPPARLPMDAAVRNYAAYQNCLDGWMLGRFVVPATRLDELAETAAGTLTENLPVRFAILSGGGSDLSEFRETVSRDFVAVAEFAERHSTWFVADVFDLCCPPETVELVQSGTLCELLDEIGLQARSARYAGDVFLELPRVDNSRPTVQAFTRALAEMNRTASHGIGFGFKLRTGGLEAAAFPSSEEVAATINTCRDADVVWKATAGLHHPIRNFDAAINVHQHGFINLLTAAVMADVHHLSERQITAILDDESPGSFGFDSDELRWNDLTVTAKDIIAARNRSLMSFGSCSFDEPRNDLRSLNLIQ